MLKTEIEFSRNTLYVSMKGMANSKNILELKRKLYYILNEYGVTDIIIDIKDVVALDKETFYEMLDDYDIKYGGNLNVIE
ncbi:MAG: hypothetical protein HFH31_01115 [Bacilli bacterium]|nr:hypothetical protein [Bacilli bacterium]